MATSGGSIAGTLLTYEKPEIPVYRTVDIKGEQKAAIAQNLQMLPKLGELAAGVNALSSEEMLKQLNRMMPGYSDMLAKGTEIINSQLRGEIPDDVLRETSRLSAEKSRAGGFAGSQFSDALTARDLGLTSLDITNRALSTADRWMAQAASRSPTFDFTNMFVSPQQRMQIKLQENAALFNRDMLKAQVDAMPEAWEAALATLFDNIEEMGSTALMAYAGGQMGGGGGMSMMGGGGGGGGGGGAAAASSGYQPQAASVQPRMYSEPIPSYQPAQMPSGSSYQYQNSYNGAPAWWP